MRTIMAISSGDPSGIGLEVVLKALPTLIESARWVLFTDRDTFERDHSRFGKDLPYRWIERFGDVTEEPLLFLREVLTPGPEVQWGNPSAESGQRALASLKAA